ALVREADDATVAALALIENIQREELNPVEEANALQRLLDEFGMTHQQVADSIGRSRTGVTNLLRLLSLNKEVKQMLSERKIEMGHAKVLLALSDKLQLTAAREVVAKQLSVRQTESLVRQLNQPPSTKSAEKEADANIQRLEQSVSEKLGASVSIQHTDKGAGKLVIQYHSLDELDGILAHLA
ncbi:MAG TPA: chromosome partitioning protein ParB, partial [Gammaproteobacteria bacterium]|nr:chromosome partitioning protein ParB [Gammaproteobacteria bacterium]